MLKIFRDENFRSNGRLVVLTSCIIHSRKYFVYLIFAAVTAYENLLTMKISQFTVPDNFDGMCVHVCVRESDIGNE